MRKTLGILLMLLMLVTGAAAQEIQLEDSVYAFPEEKNEQTNFALSVYGQSIDAESFEILREENLSGALFGVYAQNVRGEMVPLPDPENPAQNWVLETQAEPLEAFLPEEMDVYISLLSAPENYVAYSNAQVYLPVSLPGVLEYPVCRAGMTGVYLTLCGSDGRPLSGATFVLENDQASYSLETDAQGRAKAVELLSGTYRLYQTDSAAGYSAMEDAMEVQLSENEARRLEIVNAQDGSLALEVQGRTLQRSGGEMKTILERSYCIYDENGVLQAAVVSGQTVNLPAQTEGKTYVLRSESAVQDGFFADEQTHAVTVYPGQETVLRLTADSTAGYLEWEQTAFGNPVSGGTYRLEDAQGTVVLEFEADEEGTYSSPLIPAGEYILRQIRAAQDCVYTGQSVSVKVEPYLPRQEEPEKTSMQLTPISEAILFPQMEAEQGIYPSLFDQEALISIRVSMLGETSGFEMRNFQIQLDPPEVEGATVVSCNQGEMTVSIAKRNRVPGAEEISALEVSGTVSYEAGYPVSAQGDMEWKQVEASFSLPAAGFEAPAAKEASIYGWVQWEDGAAAQNIQAELIDDSGNVLSRTQTDAVGAYGFAEGQGSVQIQAPEGYGTVWEGQKAVLIPETTLSGELVFEGVAENTQAILSLEGAQDVVMQGPGTFVFSGLIAQEASVSVQTMEGILYKTETLDDGSVKVTLYPQAVIEGSVCLPDGSGVPGIEVTAAGGEKAQTHEQGMFRLEGLHPGEIEISLKIPEGLIWAKTPENLATVSAGDTVKMDFVVMEPAQVTGTVWNEQVPMEGVALTLQPGGQICTTGEDGSFSFEGLALGEYKIIADLGDEAVLEGAKFEVTASAQRQTLSIEAIIPAGISGQIWEDLDNDGFLVETEGGLSGALVELLDDQEQPVASVTTQKDGQFDFYPLSPGTYFIRVTLPDEMIFSRKAGNAQRLVAGVDGSAAQSEKIILAPGEKREGLSAGAVQSGKIYGTVWLDQNADGYFNEEEAAFAEASISLVKDGQTIAQTTPDAEGKYEFTRIRVENCQVVFTLKEGYLFTKQIFGAEEVSSNLPQADDIQASRTAELRIWHTQEEINAGVVKAANLTADVWLDEDADGRWDDSENGMAAVEARLYDNSGSSPRLVKRIETDEAGKAVFESLRPGEYLLEVGMPSEEYAATTENRAALHLTEDRRLTCGLTKPGVISGIVFQDQDMDGLRGEKENGLSVTVELLDESGNVAARTTSARNGEYAFSGVHSGMYRVRFTMEESYRFASYLSSAPSYNSDVRETDGAVGMTQLVYLPMGQELHLDAGAYQTGSISGRVWVDEDASASRSSREPGLEAVELTLLTEGAVLETVKTDSDGNFAFQWLPPGDYTIQAVIAETYYFAQTGDISGEDTLIGETAAIAIDGNTRSIGIGVVPAASISGNTGESGAAVQLMRGDQILQEQVTDEDGNYAFTRVRPGKMTLCFTPYGEWTLANAQDAVRELEVNPGEAISGINVSMIPGASVSGMMWMDANWNGVREDGEEGCRNVRVVLAMLDEGAQEETQTSEDGFYSFQNLRPGAYRIDFELPEGTLGNSESISFSLREGEDLEMESREAYRPASVQGVIWEDVNGNGQREESEGLIAQARAQAIASDGSILAEAETGEDGRYVLNQLPPVECTVCLTLPRGYLMVDEWQTERTIKLAMDEKWENMDAAVLRSGRIGDTVWLDENGNGLQDTGEAGVKGVEVSLWRVANGERELCDQRTTDENGRYRFTSVRPGRYILSFGQMDGYAPSKTVEDFAEIDSNLKESRDGCWWTEEFMLLSNGSLLNMDAGLTVGESMQALQEKESEAQEAPENEKPEEEILFF